MTNSQQLVQKFENYCNVPRDDGLSYDDYAGQLTYLLFLKMAHERTRPPYCESTAIPGEFAWPALEALENSSNLPGPDVIAAEIVEDLRAKLEEFEQIAVELEPTGAN